MQNVLFSFLIVAGSSTAMYSQGSLLSIDQNHQHHNKGHLERQRTVDDESVPQFADVFQGNALEKVGFFSLWENFFLFDYPTFLHSINLLIPLVDWLATNSAHCDSDSFAFCVLIVVFLLASNFLGPLVLCCVVANFRLRTARVLPFIQSHTFRFILNGIKWRKQICCVF